MADLKDCRSEHHLASMTGLKMVDLKDCHSACHSASMKDVKMVDLMEPMKALMMEHGLAQMTALS